MTGIFVVGHGGLEHVMGWFAPVKIGYVRVNIRRDIVLNVQDRNLCSTIYRNEG